LGENSEVNDAAELSPERRRRLRRILRLMILLGAALGFLVGELIVRSYARARYRERIAKFKSPFFVPLSDSERVFRLRGDHEDNVRVSDDSDYRWRVRTNSLGFRGPLPEAKKTRPRIVALGDSFTFGWGVQEGEDWPSRLRIAVPEIEVVNVAVPGTNTIQQAALMDELGASLAPDLVILGFVVNDAEPQLSVPLAPEVEMRFSRSWLLTRLCRELNRIDGGETDPIPIALYRYEPDYLDGFAPGAIKGQECHAALARLKQRCDSLGAKLIVVLLSDPGHDFSNYTWAPINAALTAWSKDLDLRCVDLLPRFKDLDYKSLQVPYDGHPNAEAQRIYAEAIGELVREFLKSR
jgi:lysophospholipase L1-like esterase